MTNLVLGRSQVIDVIIIGAGPAGLSAATALKDHGIRRVVVLEREAEAGGVPRHCGHPPFGFREFKRIYTGPGYAARLRNEALVVGVEIHTGVTVIEMRPNAHLLISSTDFGSLELSAARVIYATGGRETPRSARLVSGTRPLGVMNTGALQAMVYLCKQRPFKRPVIIGSELVSFSAIQTCRHANIKPVAMIEESSSVTAMWPSSIFAKLTGVPLHLSTRLISIVGDGRVEGVIIEDSTSARRTLNCDGVIFSGRFTPESSLARSSHLAIDDATGGPVVNQYGQCSDKSYFAAGNVLRAVESSGWSWEEGRQVAGWVAADLYNRLHKSSKDISVVPSSLLIKYCVPQIHVRSSEQDGLKHLQLRFTKRCRGELVVSSKGQVLWQKKVRVYPERRVLIPVNDVLGDYQGEGLQLDFIECINKSKS